jgi:hypothetical protein
VADRPGTAIETAAAAVAASQECHERFMAHPVWREGGDDMLSRAGGQSACNGGTDALCMPRQCPLCVISRHREHCDPMSALPLKADLLLMPGNVSSGPQAVIGQHHSIN